MQTYLGWLAFRRNPLALAGLAIVLTLVLVSLIGPWIATHDPTAQDLGARLLAPGEGGHWLGTDELGRDIYSRIVHGAAITLMIVLLVAATAPLAGLIVGTLSGYLGGWVDILLMRITDIFMAFPRLILALAFVAALGPGIENAILAIAITSWPPYARIARAETLTVRRSDYISAIRLQGAGTLLHGSLEASNVNVVEEMVNMIETQRAYEMGSKAISTADQMLSYATQQL